MALLEREREEGRELRPTLTLELVVYDKTLVVGLRCCRRSVGRSVSRFGGASVDIPAPADITAHQPPVDPASHDTEGDGFGCSQEGYYPASARCTPRSYRCLSVTLSSLIGRSLSTDTPVGSLSHTNALSSLSPTTREVWQ